jgi:penicillin-binding protein 1C
MQLDPLLIKAEGGVLPLTWLINGEPVASRAHERSITWQPGSVGFAHVCVIDAKGRVDRSTFRVR